MKKEDTTITTTESKHGNGVTNGQSNGQKVAPPEKPPKKGRVGKRYARAFLSDEKIGHSKTFQTLMFLVFWFHQFFHRITIDGPDFETDRNYLTIHMHTTHNRDITFGILATYRRYGLVSRGLVHRTIMTLFPFLSYMGCVPGYRDTAVQLLENGCLVSVIPGGAEEALRGHENAYNLHWPASRKGFAKVAIKSRTPIVPIFYENVEEMVFNPVFFLWNLIHGSVPYDYLVGKQIPYVSGALQTIAEMIWYTLTCFFSIPMPCKVTVHLGDPIEVDEDSNVDEIVKQSHDALQALIDKYQPGRKKSYSRAFKQWWDDVVADNYSFKYLDRKEGFEDAKHK